jgi:hypothetical protein
MFFLVVFLFHLVVMVVMMMDYGFPFFNIFVVMTVSESEGHNSEGGSIDGMFMEHHWVV